ncbi:MAG: LamG-like jellyroll fold domain-containing protein [Candidatus Methanoperedens sp.]|nr:LamG-like jellyroll fold domain-containing protein [Candidatus Methanoperedens sp.]
MLKKIIVIAILLTLALLVPVQAQEDGLVAEWHFDEGAGNVVKDSSGNGNDGTIYGATWVDGKFGKALSFDGVDDYVEILKSVSILGASPRTLEFWAYVNEITVHPHIIGWGDQTGINTNFKAAIYSVSGGSGTWFLWGSGGGNDLNTGFPVENKKWLHHVITFDGVKAEWFINGRTIGTFTHIYNTKGTSLEIGIGTLVGNPFNGLIDEVRIYNRALSAEEIKAHYEQVPTALTIKKEVSPYSIRQYQTTNVTIQIKNTGTSEIRDIEVVDSTNSNLELIGGDFPNPKKYNSLSPGESREIRYILISKESGTFILNPATVSYSDNTGNIKVVKSEPVSLTVVPSSEGSPEISSPSDIGTSSAVLLHGEKTDVVLGEDILLKLSAVNLITKPPMSVQVMIYPPSGMSVTGSEFVKSGAGIYTTTYTLNPGDGKNIEVHIISNQVGDFNVKGRIVYYFGEDKEKAEDHTLNLPIKVRKEAAPQQDMTQVPKSNPSTPGFEAILSISGILLVSFLRKKW